MCCSRQSVGAALRFPITAMLTASVESFKAIFAFTTEQGKNAETAHRLSSGLQSVIAAPSIAPPARNNLAASDEETACLILGQAANQHSFHRSATEISVCFGSANCSRVSAA